MVLIVPAIQYGTMVLWTRSPQTHICQSQSRAEKYEPNLSSDSAVANFVTSTSTASVSSQRPPTAMKSTVETPNINPELTPVKPGHCSMCGAMKSSHPTGCPNYGIICKVSGNVVMVCSSAAKLCHSPKSENHPPTSRVIVSVIVFKSRSCRSIKIPSSAWCSSSKPKLRIFWVL